MSRMDPRLEILQAVGDGRLSPDEALRRLAETPSGIADLGLPGLTSTGNAGAARPR